MKTKPMSMPRISIVVPVYNEAENILPLFYEIKKYCPENFELIWVDDGSTDETLAEIQQLSFHEERIKCISLSRNFGHQNAMLAGLNYANGEYIITMDGDLQHPPSLIPKLIEKLEQGTDIVFTKRNCTKKINWFQKTFTKLFYHFANFFSQTKIEENLTDYRAFNLKVLESSCHKGTLNNVMMIDKPIMAVINFTMFGLNRTILLSSAINTWCKEYLVLPCILSVVVK